MIYLNKSEFSLVHDLNRFHGLGHAWQISSAGGRYAFGSTRLCASHDLSALEGFQPHGSGQAFSAQSQGFLLSRSVLGPVFCSADRPRIFARYRDQLACAAPTFLSLGLSLRDHLAQHAGQRQPCSSMVSLCRFVTSFDWCGAPALRQRCNQLRAQIADGRNRLRLECDHHRSVPEPVFLDAISHHQSSHQAAHLGGFAWINPEFYSHQRRQDARCQSPRHPRKARLHRGWRLLRDSQGVC